ncbi:hypothetical protein D3C78_1455880 [compost metagenome]
MIHPNLPYIKAEVIWAINNEMAITLEDVLSRRTRALLLDAQASVECAKSVATLMANEMNKNEDWIANEVGVFNKIAANYVLKV